MPSADINDYLGLELVTNLDEATLIETALADIVVKFPDWQPRSGNTEVVLLEALAGQLAELGVSINHLPDNLTEALLRLFGFQRDTGVPATIIATINTGVTLGATIPAGTTLRLTLDDAEPYDFVTTSSVTAAPGANTVDVEAIASQPYPVINGLPPGTLVEVLDALTFVTGAVLAQAANGGTVPEDGATFLDRVTPRLRTLTATISRAIDVEPFVLSEFAYVSRVYAQDRRRQASMLPGYLTVAVLGYDGAAINSTRQGAIVDAVRDAIPAGLSAQVLTMDVLPVRVNATLTTLPGGNAITTGDAIRAALATLIDSDTWNIPNRTVSKAAVTAAIIGTGLVDVISSLTLVPVTGGGTLDPNGDITVSAISPFNVTIPTYDPAGTLTITAVT